jgi:hypothetical protein
MGENTLNAGESALEERSRSLFHESVERLDMRTRSRLTQARYAALSAAERTAQRGWFLRMPVLTSAAGVTAAAAVALALWFGGPAGHPVSVPSDPQATFEDLDIVASSDEGSGDAMEMMQDDIDFYAWADKTAGAEPSA